MNRRKFFKCTVIGSAIGLLFNPFKLRSKESQCCERDTDFDGNCDRHLAKNILKSNKYLNNFDHYLNIDELSNIGRPGQYKIHFMVGYEIKSERWVNGYYEIEKYGRIATNLNSRNKVIKTAKRDFYNILQNDSGYIEVDICKYNHKNELVIVEKSKLKHAGIFLFEKDFKLPEDKKHLDHIYPIYQGEKVE